MNWLGLDLGTKTLGVAISRAKTPLALPISVIRFPVSDYEKALQKLEPLVHQYQIQGIVLGWPKNMDNSLGNAARRSSQFAQMLKTRFQIPVTLVDERLSSVEANHILADLGQNNRKRKPIVDSVAAALILESFLKQGKE